MAEERVQDEQRIEDEEEVRPDPELEARRMAAMSFIRRFGDPVLKSKATPVDSFERLCDNLHPKTGDHLTVRTRTSSAEYGQFRSTSSMSL